MKIEYNLIVFDWKSMSGWVFGIDIKWDKKLNLYHYHIWFKIKNRDSILLWIISEGESKLAISKMFFSFQSICLAFNEM